MCGCRCVGAREVAVDEGEEGMEKESGRVGTFEDMCAWPVKE